MEFITGIIETKVSQDGQGQKGPWTKHTIEIQGHKYSTFNGEVLKEVNTGDAVKIGYEMNGQFRNIKACMKISADEIKEAPQPKTMSRATPRNSAEIGATELIRYSVKLMEAGATKDFGAACQDIWVEYSKFKTLLEN